MTGRTVQDTRRKGKRQQPEKTPERVNRQQLEGLSAQVVEMVDDDRRARRDCCQSSQAGDQDCKSSGQESDDCDIFAT